MSKDLVTPVFTLSFPNLWTPRKNDKFQSATPKFGGQAIWHPSKFGPTDQKRWAELEAAIVEVLNTTFTLKAKTRAEAEAALRRKHESAKLGIRKPDGERAKKKGYGDPDTLFASLTSGSIPGVVDQNCLPINPKEGNTDLIYPGAICRATVSPYAYNKSGGIGYALGLGNLQLLGKGPRLDGRVDPEKAFADEELDQDFEELVDNPVDTPEYDEAEVN